MRKAKSQLEVWLCSYLVVKILLAKSSNFLYTGIDCEKIFEKVEKIMELAEIRNALENTAQQIKDFRGSL
ncbi:hypothetical protein [Listeria ilorinensis]|uniref:hypothetical protein n=1 Tax=Listeria ilorinensis TaxID=2867439 RepID=UPI001EF40B72|nr:hypothetical protein [Listeria ilorinensis]